MYPKRHPQPKGSFPLPLVGAELMGRDRSVAGPSCGIAHRGIRSLTRGLSVGFNCLSNCLRNQGGVRLSRPPPSLLLQREPTDSTHDSSQQQRSAGPYCCKMHTRSPFTAAPTCSGLSGLEAESARLGPCLADGRDLSRRSVSLSSSPVCSHNLQCDVARSWRKACRGRYTEIQQAFASHPLLRA
jgi:hypothetical protein